MQVTRLEVFGFKSFMDRLVLPLESGITGVVGPNGCGKSNIVDALRWVLGETRASQLRGGVLEDVIFNGTDKLRPLGLSEVTITLRTGNGDFYDELRRAPFEVANVVLPVAVPGKEDQTENQDTAPGAISQPVEGAQPATEEKKRPQLTVVSGALDTQREEKEEQSPDEVPQEEVSVQSVQSSEDVETPENPTASRFAWLRSVSEIQVTRRLYRSGESEFFINRVACRLKDLKELFRACGLGPRAYTIVAQGEVGKIVTAKPEERRLILEDAAGILGFREKITEARRRLEETALNIARLQDIEKELGRQVASLKRQATRALQRKELKEELSTLEKAVFIESLHDFREREMRARSRYEELKGQEADAEMRVQNAASQEQECRGEMIGVDVACDQLRSKIDVAKEELNKRMRSRMELQSKLREVKAFLGARETDLRRLTERETTLAERKIQSLKEIEELDLQDKELAERLQKGDSTSEEELRQVVVEMNEARALLREKDHVLREVRDRLSSSRGSLTTIQDQLVAASPLTQLSKTLGSQLVASLPEKVSLFIDGLSIPEKYGKAVTAVLAERAKFLVAEDPHAVGRHFLSSIARRTASGDTKGLGIGVFKASAEEIQSERTLENIPRLIDLVKANDQCRLAASMVFRNVFFVESMEAFGEWIEQNPEADPNCEALFVTADGDLMTKGSFFSLRHEGGLIQMKLKAQRLQELVQEHSERQEILNRERDEIAARLQKTELRHGELLKNIQAQQAQLRELGKLQGSLRGRSQAARRVVEQIEQDLNRLVQQMEEGKARLFDLVSQSENLEAEVKTREQESDTELNQMVRALTEELLKAEETRREGRGRLERIGKEVNDTRRALDALRSAASQEELELRKVELEEANLRERVSKDYGEEEYAILCEQAPKVERLDAALRREHEQRAHAIRSRIQREGEVDPSVVQQYEEENARLEPLRAQREDLEGASAAIQDSMDQLTKTSVDRFLATFEAVKGNFVSLVPRLFGGGKADLVLSHPENPLESGVDIVVRPPGKKPKTLELLSGGEKALCATALIFSMFMERPSPLCVLDEVDAPLDEANLLRFLDVVREMSNRTQFIMITHNKQSMQIANNLAGVTMHEPGASRVISVSLQEALAHVA